MGLAGHLSRQITASAPTRKKKKIRAWQLDAVPLLVDQETWTTISEGVAQRAQMNELLLRDLYGPQRLIRENVIPAKLIHSHPEFLRAIHNNQSDNRTESQSDNQPFLQLAAFDLARSPDGNWWVLNDRTESPSGLGFVHENRIVLSRAYPEIFQSYQVAQLSPFFDQLQARLLDLAGGNFDGNGVLLGEGIAGKNLFEEAYLARTLGYTMVRGDDLTVRNDGVYFKTLGGLKPVSLIIRRRNSRDCDPLELQGTATSGTPGLVNAFRKNQVAISNRLGSGLVESRSIMAFGSRICRALLGEDLKIPNVATWWCGEAKVLPFVLENLDRLTIEAAFRTRGGPDECGIELSQLSLDQRKAKIVADPDRYVAQERVDRSSVPIWNGSGLESAKLVLRTFAVAGEDGFEVMQGGLGRTMQDSELLYDSMDYGKGGKDVWVQSADEQPKGPALGVSQTMAPRRSGFELSSRSADNLFWLGRQIERIYFLSCVLRSTIDRLIGESKPGLQAEGQILVRCLAMQGQLALGFASGPTPSALDLRLPEMVLDDSVTGSVATAVNELLRLGQMERNCMSLDTWRTILRIHERIGVDQPDLQGLLTLADELVVDVSALGGLTSESMTRNQVFRFVQIGRRIEHALQLIFLLRSFFVPKVEPVAPILQTALEVADSIMTYRSRYFANYQLSSVLDLLVTDETNPRSIVWQIFQLEKHVRQLPEEEEQSGPSRASKLSASLLNSVRAAPVQTIAESWMRDDVKPLEELLNTWQRSLPQIHAAISNRYFVHADTSRQIMQ